MPTSTASWTNTNKADFAKLMGSVCSLQNQYGKSPADLHIIVEGFFWILGEYPFEKVVEGIREFCKNNSRIPTPSDIKIIIDPPKPEFRPDWEYYKSLKDLVKNGGAYAISTDENAYINRCESYSLNRMKQARE